MINAQIVPSTCAGVDSAISEYMETATYRAYNHYAARSHDYFIDSIPIYDSMKNRYLDAIMAIYNTIGIERDSIFVYHKIKSFLPTFLNRIIIKCDTSLDWGKNLASMQFVTGNNSLDSMLDLYHFDTILNTYILSNYRFIRMQSDSFYNTIALAQHFNGVDGVTLAGPNQHYGDGDDVYDSVGVNTIDIAFSRGWGVNCPTGVCDYRKYWRYRVYDDCSVEYLGHVRMGRTQIFNNIEEIIKPNILIYPNPFKSELFVDFQEVSCHKYKLLIYTISGQLLSEDKLSDNSSGIAHINTEFLCSGMYFAKIIDENNNVVFTNKLVKE